MPELKKIYFPMTYIFKGYVKNFNIHMVNFFYLIFKALFVLIIFTFLSYLFGHVGKRLDNKAKVKFQNL